MTKGTDISTSDSETSTGNNNACSTKTPAGGQDVVSSTVPPAAPAPTTHKPSKPSKQTSTKQNSQRVATLPLPPPPPPPPTKSKKTTTTVVPSPPPPKPKKTTARVAPSPPQPKPKKTTARVVPSPPLAKPRKTTTVVPIFPKPPPALRINSNETGIEARQHPVGVTFPWPYGGGIRPVPHPVDLAFSMPYGRGNGPLDPFRVTFPQSFDARNGSYHSGGAHFSQARGNGNERYHPYQRHMDHQPVGANLSQGAVDFLSQMEAGGSARRQVRRENPPIEILAEWGATLRLGNAGTGPVDLNLKLRMV